MQEIIHAETRPKTALDFPFLLALLTFAALTQAIWPVIEYVRTGTVDLNGWEGVMMAARIVVLLCPVLFALQWVAWSRSKALYSYRLSADEDGLTYANGRSSWHWAWSELSAFEHVPGSWWRGEHVRFRPGSFSWKDSWKGSFYWAHAAAQRISRSTRGWECYLLDSFDRSLAEIAAELNDLRGRALRDSVET